MVRKFGQLFAAYSVAFAAALLVTYLTDRLSPVRMMSVFPRDYSEGVDTLLSLAAGLLVFQQSFGRITGIGRGWGFWVFTSLVLIIAFFGALWISVVMMRAPAPTGEGLAEGQVRVELVEVTGMAAHRIITVVKAWIGLGYAFGLLAVVLASGMLSQRGVRQW